MFQLIEELKLARQEDDHNEQRMLNEIAWNDSGESATTAQVERRFRRFEPIYRHVFARAMADFDSQFDSHGDAQRRMEADEIASE